MKKLWLYLLAFTISIASACAQSTTVTAETSNNTTASPTFPGLQDFRTNDSLTPNTATNPNIMLGAPLETPLFDESPKNISKINVHSLMYPGFNGKILVETQTWFCSNHTTDTLRDYSDPNNDHLFPQCHEHLIVGYDSDPLENPAQPNTHSSDAANDMLSRGFDGFMADVSGGQNNCRTGSRPLSAPFSFTAACPAKFTRVDNAVQAMMREVNSAPQFSEFQFMLMEDQSAFATSENCAPTDPLNPETTQALCIAQKIESDLDYYNLTYFSTSPSSYLKNASGAAFIAFFVAEEQQFDSSNNPLNPIGLSQCNSGATACPFENGTTCGGTFNDANSKPVSNCWTAIWDAVRAHAPVPIAMIFRNFPGLTHDQSDGAFQWVDARQEVGSGITSQSQEDWPNGNEVDQFYSAASTSGKVVFGIAKKGFDREDAPFETMGNGHVTAQQCGQVWLDSFQEVSKYFSTGNQIPFMVVGTWDDYEEGTEIETGIDNCFTMSANQLKYNSADNGVDGVLQWSLNATDPHWSASTVDHYTVYSSTDGQNLTVFQDPAPCAQPVSPQTLPSCTIDVINNTTLALGTYGFFVKAAGKPSIVNHLSSGVSLTVKNFGLRETTDANGNFVIIIAAHQGYTGTVSLSASGMPAGGSVSFSPQQVSGAGTSTVSPLFPTSASGCYYPTVTGTDGSTSSSVVLGWCFMNAVDFSEAISPSSGTVTAGGSASFSATQTPSNGFTATVTFSASGVPAGAVASFNPSSLTGGSGTSQMTVSTSSSTAPGTYTIRINATGGGRIDTQTVTLTVNAPPTGGGGGGCIGSRCLNQ